MNNRVELLSFLLNQIAELTPGRRNIYLVGGAVRDYLINKPIYDWDFVMEGDVRPISKKLADYFQGAYYLLDEERIVTRVIISFHGEKMVFDFASYRAESLNGDLEKRDFTINAMALSIHNPNQLIDPLGGKMDLQNRILRNCHPGSFMDDPARTLRGIRLSVNLGLNIEDKTLRALREAVPLLSKVSVERQRDELFKIFGLGQTHKAVTLLEENGILDVLIPEVKVMKEVKQSPPHVYDVWEHSLLTLNYLDVILNGLFCNQTEISIENSTLILPIDSLLKYQSQLVQHFCKELSPGRSRRALLLFSALCHDIGKPDCRMIDEHEKIRFLGHERQGAEMSLMIADRLCLSNDEKHFVNIVVGQHMRIHSLAQSGQLPDRRIIHRYFRSTGEAGIDIIFLSLGDSLATWGKNISLIQWSRELMVCDKMIETWFENNEDVINPKRLLSGNEIIKILQIEPGPKVGKAVLALTEAQGAGEVLTVEDAVNYIKEWFHKQVEGEAYDDISSN